MRLHDDATPDRKLEKTALGAISSVPCEHFDATLAAVRDLRARGLYVVALETTEDAVPLGVAPQLGDEARGVALVLGNEVTGVDKAVMEACDAVLEIPVFGVRTRSTSRAARRSCCTRCCGGGASTRAWRRSGCPDRVLDLHSSCFGRSSFGRADASPRFRAAQAAPAGAGSSKSRAPPQKTGKPPLPRAIVRWPRCALRLVARARRRSCRPSPEIFWSPAPLVWPSQSRCRATPGR